MAAAALLAAAACDRTAPAGPPQIALVPASGSSAPAFIEVTGLTRSELQALRRPTLTPDDWQRVLLVSVKPTNGSTGLVPIAGTYAIAGNALRFTPAYAFDPGRTYEAVFDGQAASLDGSDRTARATVALAAAATTPTFVTQVYPSGDILAENQLRMYVHFSAPMGRRGGITHITLLDEKGKEVEEPFLPLDAEFWNGERTRYTLFFDPGRQKRGILPNREMGPSLVAGRTVTLVVDRGWIDGNGNPLRESFTKKFRVGPPDRSPIDHSRWKITPAAAGTRDPLTVTFPEPLDHGLLLRAVGVRFDGKPVTGEVRVEEHETRWRLIPTTPWQTGPHELIALSILEDVAGNRIGRAFEIDAFERVDSVTEPEPTRVPFVVK